METAPASVSGAAAGQRTALYCVYCSTAAVHRQQRQYSAGGECHGSSAACDVCGAPRVVCNPVLHFLRGAWQRQTAGGCSRACGCSSIDARPWQDFGGVQAVAAARGRQLQSGQQARGLFGVTAVQACVCVLCWLCVMWPCVVFRRCGVPVGRWQMSEKGV